MRDYKYGIASARNQNIPGSMVYKWGPMRQWQQYQAGSGAMLSNNVQISARLRDIRTL